MYLDSSSPLIAGWINALGGDARQTTAAMLVARPGSPVVVTLEQTVESKLLQRPVDLEIDYKLIRRDYAAVLEPLIEELTGTRNPTASELRVAVNNAVKRLNETNHSGQ